MINYWGIPFAAIFLLCFCFGLDWFIWWMNAHWAEAHPKHKRHPYSPLFTAIGTTGILVALLVVIPWWAVAVVFAAFVVYGGLMWMLHYRRWLLRLEEDTQQKNDNNHSVEGGNDI